MKRQPNQIKKIAFVAQPEYFSFIYEHDLDKLADVRAFRFHFSMKVDDFSELIDFDADINFFFRGEFFPSVILEKLRGITVNLSSEPFPRVINDRLIYTIDSIRRYLHFRNIRSKPFDYVFHYDDTSIPFLNSDGLLVSGEFALPVATSVYKPDARPEKWQIFFNGRSTSHRERFFEPLKHQYHFLHIAHGIWGNDLIEYIQSAAICLNVHAEHEVSWEPRLQMLLACGAFVISEAVTPNSYLRPGIDFIEVCGPAEMHKAVRYYLEHQTERHAISRNGALRVREVLDSQQAFKKLLIGIQEGAYPRFSTGNGRLIFNVLGNLFNLVFDIRNRQRRHH